MSQIQIKEQAPGLNAAKYVQDKIRQLGIQDVQLFFDPQIKMWAICQVQSRSSSLILPASYSQDNIRPMIMWWCKDSTGRFRPPSDQDISDLIIVRRRAEKIWEQEEKQPGWLDDQLIKQENEKKLEHAANKKAKAKEVAHRLNIAAKKTTTSMGGKNASSR